VSVEAKHNKTPPRPTPEQIAVMYTSPLATSVKFFMNDLAEHGYVIVHTDDLRARDEAIIRATWNLGRPAAPRRAATLIDLILADAEQETLNGHPTN
jgi:hypothetical protein